MKTIGLIAGISWHSSAVYYSQMNTLVNKKLGNDHAARIIMYSLNYADFKKLQVAGNWKGIEVMLTDMALMLQEAGADCVLISCNSAHLVADAVASKLRIPFLHIADAMAKELREHKLNKVALIGTKFVMENTFFSERLAKAEIEVVLPNEPGRSYIHNQILKELAYGVFNADTRNDFIRIMEELAQEGAQAVILACTEIGILINQSHTNIPLFDTTDVHIKAAVEFALLNGPQEEVLSSHD